ncbi:alcohol dehydrogenase catalytic domain-containing protein [Klebsiella variicola subsp. variicola]|nr:alcohol dehydrogenase catalytic domain-containing protein [Klebsiella variicola subsp. variicola]
MALAPFPTNTDCILQKREPDDESLDSQKPGSLENLQLSILLTPGRPLPGEIRVALHATSLNYHDLLVATGVIPTADRRILMADGAGVVEAVGAGVNEFQPGDRVVAGFFPQWLDGRPGPLVSDFSQTPGDGAEGVRLPVYVVRPASHFTHAPEGWSFRGGGNHHHLRSYRLARAGRRRTVKSRRYGADAWYRRRVDNRPAAGEKYGRAGDRHLVVR